MVAAGHSGLPMGEAMNIYTAFKPTGRRGYGRDSGLVSRNCRSAAR